MIQITENEEIPEYQQDSTNLTTELELGTNLTEILHLPHFPKYKSNQKFIQTSKTQHFDFILICTGHHYKPNIPSFPGISTFKGTVIHSSKYKVPYPFKDDRVLVVGVGNSGIDISSELVSHSEVLLSSRSGNWISPRTTFFGLATDHLNTRAIKSIPRVVLNYAYESLITIHHGDLGQLKPTHKALESSPVISSQILEHIQSGKIKVVGDVKCINEDIVELKNGEKFEIDSIILCTGYKIENPFIDDQIYGKEQDSNRVRLYKNVFPTNCDGLGFVGLVQPSGSILPVAEMQARWCCKVFMGDGLPKFVERRDLTDIDYREHLKKFVPRERMTIAVDQNEYMDMLAEKIGCMPDYWHLFPRDPVLALKVVFGPSVAAHYRLYGVGSSDQAPDIINNACKGLDLKATALKITGK